MLENREDLNSSIGAKYKTLAVGNYFIELARKAQRSLTALQLNKLAYIAHGRLLGRYGRPLLLEEVEAWRFGVIVPSLYQATKRFGEKAVSYIDGYSSRAPIDFSEQEKQVLEETFKLYGEFDGVTLSTATNQPSSPYQSVAITYPAQTIPNSTIQLFYRSQVITKSIRLCDSV